MNTSQLLLVAMGGMLGSVLRYAAVVLVDAKTLHYWGIPWATFLVNILGSLIIGLAMAYQTSKQSTVGYHGNWVLFFTTGFCGGFTTFSALTKEGFLMLSGGQYLHFIIYFFMSIALGLLAVALGYYMGTKFFLHKI